jgi:hypothetical protein
MLRHLRLLPAAALLAGCSLLDVAPPTNSSTGIPYDLNKQMKATIDGIAWEAQIVSITQNENTIRFTGVLNVGQPSERSVILQFRKGIDGVQTFGDGGGTYAQVGVGNSNLQTWATRANGPTGSMSISLTGLNHYVGTFSFEAAGNYSNMVPETRSVTNGTFDVKF